MNVSIYRDVMTCGLFLGTMCGSPATVESRQSGIPIHEIAAFFAPTLRFTQWERLRQLSGDRNFPSLLPCDAPGADVAAEEARTSAHTRDEWVQLHRGAYVYYQVDAVSELSFETWAKWYLYDRQLPRPGDGREAVDTVTQTLDLSRAEGFVLKYMFYYEEDFGAHGHVHDVESVEVYVQVQRPDSVPTKGRLAEDAYQSATESIRRFGRWLRPVAVIGAAHGSKFYANRLLGFEESQFGLPLVVLVEENKHASAPDRDRDGRLTLGTDLNWLTGDGWGVRDGFGAGLLLRNRFDAAMARERGDSAIVVAPDNGPSTGTGWHYRLRPAWDARRTRSPVWECAGLNSGDDPSRSGRVPRDWRPGSVPLLKKAEESRAVLDTVAALMRRYRLRGDPQELVDGTYFLRETGEHYAWKVGSHPNVESLGDLLTRARFGQPPRRRETPALERLARPRIMRHEAPLLGIGTSVRFDGDWGVQVYPFGAYVGWASVWVVPRLAIRSGHWKRIDVLFTPSASSWNGWGSSVGMSWGEGVTHGTAEIGVVPVRAKVQSNWLPYFFALRTGLAMEYGRSPESPRTIGMKLFIELGSGVW